MYKLLLHKVVEKLYAMLQALKAAEEAEKEWEADNPLQKGDIGLTAGL